MFDLLFVSFKYSLYICHKIIYKQFKLHKYNNQKYEQSN